LKSSCDRCLLTIGTTAAITDATFLILFKQKERQLAAAALRVAAA